MFLEKYFIQDHYYSDVYNKNSAWQNIFEEDLIEPLVKLWKGQENYGFSIAVPDPFLENVDILSATSRNLALPELKKCWRTYCMWNWAKQ